MIDELGIWGALPARGAAIALLVAAAGWPGVATAAVGAPPAAFSFSVAEGPRVSTLAVTLVPSRPPGAATFEVRTAGSPAAWVAYPLAGPVSWRLPEGPDGPRTVMARFLDGAGQRVGATARVRVVYDGTPPAPPAARVAQAEPVIICRPGGPRVAGARTSLAPYDLTLDDIEPGGLVQVTRDPRAPGGARGALRALRMSGRPGGSIWIRQVDRAGNIGAWSRVGLPTAQRVVATPASLPFTRGLDCPGPPPAARIRAVLRSWNASGGTAPHRARLRPAGSALVWTAYRGQSLALNWVHAGTDLNYRLRSGRIADYRAGVAEVLAHSVVDVSPAGTRFRLNENRFADPDDRRIVGWRDAMGTAVLLATLVPALPSDAPAHERQRAREVASDYLAAFSVDYRSGGVVWRDGGPGEWFLEYTHRPRARVLNGSMQAVVSLARFERQAARMAVSDSSWEPLRADARGRVLAGAQAIHRWLPAYDLGSGATRYALGGGPATPEYRRYHAELLSVLARVSYLPMHSRQRFGLYRDRWGGPRLAPFSRARAEARSRPPAR